ncbi:uncharacterized protein GGS22DRAFT_146091 [Annulohypoxylon maeteangense]|uniref:uncharacterized protein n=1 Tax=Annulohypoxylon maeteangense TaxID=1927788 RepID=UPI00200732A9|nr:uncharacterized protein GGS22DRAFT_146091 [Annulohypoxylon maeteangense]KAI0884710.1 hypothetical protein GGS22DRAFT_146091 [Annulohypoxylon maeteangense]
MGKSEFRDWWRSQTAHPSRLQPTVPICPCAACFNGTGHDQEVSANPIDPGEILPLRKSKNTASSIEKPVPQSNEKDATDITPVKKPWYKQATGLARKPSRASIASDLAPLCSTSTTQSSERMSVETLV